MKTIMLAIALTGVSVAMAQNSVRISPPVEKADAIKHTSEGDLLSFTLAREANIKYYIVEGSNDSSHFEFVGRLQSKGNSVMPRAYEFLNAGTTYQTYRVSQMDMSGVTAQTILIENIKLQPKQAGYPNSVILTSK